MQINSNQFTQTLIKFKFWYNFKFIDLYLLNLFKNKNNNIKIKLKNKFMHFHLKKNLWLQSVKQMFNLSELNYFKFNLYFIKNMINYKLKNLIRYKFLIKNNLNTNVLSNVNIKTNLYLINIDTYCAIFLLFFKFLNNYWIRIWIKTLFLIFFNFKLFKFHYVSKKALIFSNKTSKITNLNSNYI